MIDVRRRLNDVVAEDRRWRLSSVDARLTALDKGGKE
jgi:hypothetical protein